MATPTAVAGGSCATMASTCFATSARRNAGGGTATLRRTVKRDRDTLPCWRVPVVAGRDTAYTDSLRSLRAGGLGGRVRPVARRRVRPAPADSRHDPAARRHPRQCSLRHRVVEPVQYDTMQADIAATSIPSVMVSVGIDDGAFAGSPLGGVIVTVLAADSTALAPAGHRRLGAREVSTAGPTARRRPLSRHPRHGIRCRPRLNLQPEL